MEMCVEFPVTFAKFTDSLQASKYSRAMATMLWALP
jgi:hypothetical protein